jgi:hypothetical protein
MSVTYLRQFPGKRRFQRVSKDDWEAPLPRKDIAGFGHILRLEADVRVYAPGGELVIARKWPSKSYIRNFARVLRNMFGQSVQLVDISANNQTVPLDVATGVAGVGLIGGLLNYATQFNSAGNPELGGLGMAIGQGVFVANHQRNDLISRVGGIYSSRQNVRTSVQNTSTFTLEVTTGVTNGQATTINVTEIGMYLFALTTAAGNASACPFATLFAHDGIASTPVASGGVIAPRYTMDFPV